MRIRSGGLAIAVALAALMVASVCATSAHADVTIGIYKDQSGSFCNFTDNNPGIIDAYVVARPDARGLRGVRFSTPVPACYGAVWVEDIVPEYMHSIGQSSTGISISSVFCEEIPVSMLQIRYMQSGSTTPCCAFPVLDDPIVNMIEVVDCNFESFAASGTTAYFNANLSCMCGFNSPPNALADPSPANNATAVIVTTALSWSASDPENNIQSYDVYLGTTNPPALFVAEITEMMYQPPQLAELTTFYWRVVARDAFNATTSSPTWTFTTRAVNTPPIAPYAPSPVSGATNVALGTELAWASSDIDQDPIEFDVYFGTSSPPPLVAEGVMTTSYAAETQALDTIYYWQIVARDLVGHETSGPIWSFRTRPEFYPPGAPSNPFPSNGATNRPFTGQLIWSATDPDPSDVLEFDVYFGPTSSPPKVATQASASYAYSATGFSTTHYWRIVARDNHGLETAGPTWSFVTKANSAPNAPSSPAPEHESHSQPVAQTLAWTCTDPDGQAVTFDVYFGNGPIPPKVATGHASPSYDPGLLNTSTRYYWRVVARDALGLERASPTWWFNTVVPTDVPRDSKPLVLSLGANHPNPFNPQTVIPYTIPGSVPVRVRLAIYDTSGRLIRELVDEEQVGGSREVVWRGDDASGRTVSSGVYFSVLQVGKEQLTRKLVLLK